MRQADADLLALEDRAPLVPALGDEGDRLAGQVVEHLEGVEVGVGADQMDLARLDELVELLLPGLALATDFGEPGGEDHREAGLLLDGLLEGRHGVAHEDDGDVDVVVDVEDRAGAGHAVDGVLVGVDGVHGGAEGLAPRPDLPVHRGVGALAAVRRADHRQGPWTEEHVERHRARLDRPAGDVETRQRRVLRHECQGS